MRVEYLTSDSKRKYTDISCSNKDYRRSSDVPAHKRTRTAANHSEFATCRKIIFDHGFFGCRPVGGEPRLGYDSPRAVDPPPGLSQSSEATLTFGAYIPESCYSHNGPGTMGPARARARDRGWCQDYAIRSLISIASCAIKTNNRENDITLLKCPKDEWIAPVGIDNPQRLKFRCKASTAEATKLWNGTKFWTICHNLRFVNRLELWKGLVRTSIHVCSQKPGEDFIIES